MTQESMERVLHTEWMAEKIFWRNSVDSTLIWAKEEADFCLGENLKSALFLADKQTAGKGRLGRVWNSPAGENVYMTLLLLKPPVEPVKASSLTLVMGLSVAQAVRDITGISAGIKWPNDVVAAGKKICGILTEMKIRGEKAEYVSIGVGINMNQREFPEELQDKATSLALELGCEVVREEITAGVVERFEKNYELFLEKQDLQSLREEYERLLLNKDRQVRILEKEKESIGIARGITPAGELLVEDENGAVRQVLSGEVSVRGLYSYV